MEAAILAHVHPLDLGPSFRPWGGQALPLPTVNLLTLFSLLLMIAYDCFRNPSSTKLNVFLYFCLHNVLLIFS